jgi:lipopolysaccharide export LptBFGC system permease protein LptF
MNMNAETVFPRTQIVKGDNEKTIAELRQTAAENTANHAPAYSQIYTIHQKFSLPAACLVLALIGVALGATSRKDGKLAGFAIGTGVVFVYYVLLYSSRAAALAGALTPAFAPWIVNVVLGAVGIGLVLWRAGSSDQPIRISLPSFWRDRDAQSSRTATTRAAAAGHRRRVVLVVRVPHIDWPRPSLLDMYVSRLYLAVFALAFVSLVGIFYISTLIDLAANVFRGVATPGLLLRYFYFETPQYVYYIIPLAALLATLVTVGLLTKNSELIVMRACGISLYRSAVPLVLFAVVFSGALFELQERVLADSNREAARLNAIIRGLSVPTFGILNRQWVVGHNGASTATVLRSGANQFAGCRSAGQARLGLRTVTRAGGPPDSTNSCRRTVALRGVQSGVDAQVAHHAPQHRSPVVTYTPFAERVSRSSRPATSRPRSRPTA